MQNSQIDLFELTADERRHFKGVVPAPTRQMRVAVRAGTPPTPTSQPVGSNVNGNLSPDLVVNELNRWVDRQWEKRKQAADAARASKDGATASEQINNFIVQSVIDAQ